MLQLRTSKPPTATAVPEEQRAQRVDLASKFPRSRFDRASVEHAGTSLTRQSMDTGPLVVSCGVWQ